MSKLSVHQLRSSIERMESTLSRLKGNCLMHATKVVKQELKIAEAKRELLAKEESYGRC